MRGTVKMVADKGFGFVSPEDGSADVFFHASNLKDLSFDDVKIGTIVTFDIIDGDKGLKATSIELAV